MKRARAVIGANFGDEGKGLVADYLCATEGAGVVVRYNGGAQAGHTVVLPDGTHHIFHHFGSGTLCGVPTFLSQFFVCNPIVGMYEADTLLSIGVNPILYAHPNCLVTTFADMMINQQLEDKRGDQRHGSVGVGFQETINRSDIPELKITMSDLWNNIPLEKRLMDICTKYAEFRTGSKLEKPDEMINEFTRRCAKFAESVHPLGIAQCADPIFEGAQGLLLSQDNKEYFPHLTRSYTGMKNVRILCEQAGIDKIEPYYVSRTYLTRHGAGPLPGEHKTRYEDNTNLDNQYQGKLRFGTLDVPSLLKRCQTDAGAQKLKLVLTHCDQLAAPCSADLYASGPTRETITSVLETPLLKKSANG